MGLRRRRRRASWRSRWLLPPTRTCIRCRCTESRACLERVRGSDQVQPCAWVYVDPLSAFGCCSACKESWLPADARRLRAARRATRLRVRAELRDVRTNMEELVRHLMEAPGPSTLAEKARLLRAAHNGGLQEHAREIARREFTAAGIANTHREFLGGDRGSRLRRLEIRGAGEVGMIDGAGIRTVLGSLDVDGVVVDVESWRDFRPRGYDPANMQGIAYLEELHAAGVTVRDRYGFAPVEEIVPVFATRDRMVWRYSWAVPTPAALEVLARYGPLVEIGAGTGYWSHLLRERGVDVVAYDIHPPGGAFGTNAWHPNRSTWTRVLHGGPRAVLRHPTRTLFLCWPPARDGMAAEALRLTRAAHVAYIGTEWCTANAAFHTELHRSWIPVDGCHLPTWPGVDDYLSVYRRKTLVRGAE